jgi:hypothetical protein
MLTNFDELIISNYSPISAKGGSKAKRGYRRRRSSKNKTKKLKRSNKSRTRRTYR